MLDHYNPLSDPETLRNQGIQLMTSAFRRWPAKDDPNQVFLDVLAVCQKPGPSNWCWSLLPSVAEARLDCWTALSLAIAFSGRETRADAQRALGWVERAESSAASDKTLEPASKPYLAFGSGYARAHAFRVLGAIGEVQRFEDAKRVLLPLVDSPPAATDSRLQLDALSVGHGLLLEGPTVDADRAASFAERGVKAAPQEPRFWSLMAFAGLRFGNEAAVQRACARQPPGRPPRARSGARAEFLFVAAVGGLMRHADAEWTSSRFIRTGHRYAPIVSMLLSARTSDDARVDARRLLEERWRALIAKHGTDAPLEATSTLGTRCCSATMPGTSSRRNRRSVARRLNLRGPPGLPYSRSAEKGCVTEGHFYEAIAPWKPATRHAPPSSLRRVVELAHTIYLEYDMAVPLASAESSAR